LADGLAFSKKSPQLADLWHLPGLT
jgi:hypothetical protein